MNAMEFVFWACVFILLYSFIGYSLILRFLVAFWPQKHQIDDKHFPSVSIVLSVYNEADVIKEKIENFLALDYPEDRFEFVIVSDQCSDKTEEIIRSFSNSRIKLLIQEVRSGKTLNLNRGVTESNGEVIVFTDANSMFDSDAVKKLVRHFVDPVVGLVSGRSVYIDSVNNNEEIGGAYRRYEEMVKEKESSLASIVGADGAIYALRKDLYEPLDPKYINDFIHTIQVELKGKRAISEPEAICQEVVDETYDDELGRQTRMMAQSWLVFFTQIGKLIACRRYLYVFEFLSHKVLRWVSLPLMMMVFITNVFLVSDGYIYLIILCFQSLFYLLAIKGRKAKSGFIRVPFFFVLIQYASLLGLYRLLSGNTYTTWNPRND
jgi:cellulose synthase/poly-beta-1,6-N-acetylglucosamine synthase-like glycosyltransferase